MLGRSRIFVTATRKSRFVHSLLTYSMVIYLFLTFFSGVSVSVSCFTLVAMSLERYFAICRPLHSRQWQTLSHAYKTIAACWLLASIVVLPIAVYTKLISTKDGKVSFCRERWPTKAEEQAYTIFLDWMLLLIPVIIMASSYGSIVRTLWIGIKMDMRVQEGKIWAKF